MEPNDKPKKNDRAERFVSDASDFIAKPRKVRKVSKPKKGKGKGKK